MHQKKYHKESDSMSDSDSDDMPQTFYKNKHISSKPKPKVELPQNQAQHSNPSNSSGLGRLAKTGSTIKVHDHDQTLKGSQGRPRIKIDHTKDPKPSNSDIGYGIKLMVPTEENYESNLSMALPIKPDIQPSPTHSQQTITRQLEHQTKLDQAMDHDRFRTQERHRQAYEAQAVIRKKKKQAQKIETDKEILISPPRVQPTKIASSKNITDIEPKMVSSGLLGLPAEYEGKIQSTRD
jgi:hypothetical protein